MEGFERLIFADQNSSSSSVRLVKVTLLDWRGRVWMISGSAETDREPLGVFHTMSDTRSWSRNILTGDGPVFFRSGVDDEGKTEGHQTLALELFLLRVREHDMIIKCVCVCVCVCVWVCVCVCLRTCPHTCLESCVRLTQKWFAPNISQVTRYF